jgi:protein-L-isoaspartate(D-aspartate) O-methyltransferase
MRRHAHAPFASGTVGIPSGQRFPPPRAWSIVLLILPIFWNIEQRGLRSDQEPFAARRSEMVASQIAARGVRDPRVLSALREVPRHLFVPPAEQMQAYEDHAVPIGYGQTISQPYIVAMMTELVRPQAGDRALEIGTGSGYQAAVLSRLVSHVYSIEIVEPLGREAERRLNSLGYSNVTVRIGDGYAGWSAMAPFDLVVVTAAPEQVPPPLVAQLKAGGRLVIPVGSSFDVQQLQLIEKDASGRTRTRQVAPVRFVPFQRGR